MSTLLERYPHLDLQAPLLQFQAYERDIRCNFKEPTQEKYALVDLQLVQEIDMAKIATDTKRIFLHSSAQELEKNISTPLQTIYPKSALLKRMFGDKDYSQAEQICACAYDYYVNDMVIYSNFYQSSRMQFARVKRSNVGFRNKV
ncbi:hypothetical protein [Helicobacter felis]|uniref:hypothetical protein n=1 Tax=Helicobacter felis TaxID=214 RepID=UPI000CF11039|nr:hypothetical protein [Helicobacter felis]